MSFETGLFSCTVSGVYLYTDIMKLQAEIDGQNHQIEFKRENGCVTAVIDGRVIKTEVSEPEPGVFLFRSGGRVIETYVGPFVDGATTVSVRGHQHEIGISDPKRLRGSAKPTDAAGGRAEIKTAMPGKVVRILIADGDEVQKGDGLIVVEAMKMQNEMRSPKQGHISGLRVSEGDTVAAGDVLLVVE
jgi:biotin carboxyl carrier protein